VVDLTGRFVDARADGELFGAAMLVAALDALRRTSLDPAGPPPGDDAAVGLTGQFSTLRKRSDVRSVRWQTSSHPD